MRTAVTRQHDQHDQDQCSRPRLAMPVIVGRHGVSEYLQRERGGGSLIFQFQYWLPKAVNKNGAVSPATRAKASITPVMTPEVAVRKVIDSVVRQRETPNPYAASRNDVRDQQQHFFGSTA